MSSSTHIPAQDTIFLIAFVVTVGTLLIQGLSLPWVIRTLDVHDPAEGERDTATELALSQRTTRAALDLIEERRGAWSEQFGAEAVAASVGRLTARLERQSAEFRQDAEDENADAVRSPDRLTAPQIQVIRRELLQRRREVVLEQREHGALDEEVMRRVMVTLDAEELAVDSSQAGRSRS